MRLLEQAYLGMPGSVVEEAFRDCFSVKQFVACTQWPYLWYSSGVDEKISRDLRNCRDCTAF
jgi:hypothetical protein